jgi:hypothetical protein
MTFEEFIIQTKTLKQIAKFMNVSERQIASLQKIHKATPRIGSPNDIDYEDRLIAQESRGEWMNSKEREYIKGVARS